VTGAAETGAALTLRLWRDHDEELVRLPAVSLGSRQVDLASPDEAAVALYRDGVRRVAVDAPVDLTGPPRAAVDRLLLVGQLTSWAIVVDWQLRPADAGSHWPSLSHLYPPTAILGTDDADDIRERWRRRFYVCRCIWRQGPGFIEVRDRRAESLTRFVIDEPDYLRAVERLSAGCRADEIPAAVLADLAGEDLIGRAGDLVWWLPYRVRRWPSAALLV
jgi:hypothetical protein